MTEAEDIKIGRKGSKLFPNTKLYEFFINNMNTYEVFSNEIIWVSEMTL